jgi:O-antigen/teichoic acid export membrane protein
LIQSTVALLSQFAGLAMGSTATKFVAEYRTSDPLRAGRILGLCSAISCGMGSLAAIALLAGASWLTIDVLKAPGLVGAMRLGAGALLFSTMNGYQLGALTGLEGFRAMAHARLLIGGLYLLVCGLCTWRWGFTGAIGGLLAAMVIQWLVLAHFLRKECARKGVRISHRRIWQERKIIGTFAVPAALNGLMTTPATWLAQAVLARQPDGLVQMGIYTSAQNLTSIVRLCPNVVDNVSIAVLNNHKGQQDGVEYRRAFRMNLLVVVLAVLAFGPVIFWLAPWLLTFYGNGFAGAVPVLRILLLALVFEVVATAVYQIIRSHKRMWKSFFFIAMPSNALLLLTSAVLSPRLGGSGLAWAYVASWGASLIATTLLVRRTDLEFGGNMAEPRS